MTNSFWDFFLPIRIWHWQPPLAHLALGRPIFLSAAGKQASKHRDISKIFCTLSELLSFECKACLRSSFFVEKFIFKIIKNINWVLQHIITNQSHYFIRQITSQIGSEKAGQATQCHSSLIHVLAAEVLAYHVGGQHEHVCAFMKTLRCCQIADSLLF